MTVLENQFQKDIFSGLIERYRLGLEREWNYPADPKAACLAARYPRADPFAWKCPKTANSEPESDETKIPPVNRRMNPSQGTDEKCREQNSHKDIFSATADMQEHTDEVSSEDEAASEHSSSSSILSNEDTSDSEPPSPSSSEGTSYAGDIKRADFSSALTRVSSPGQVPDSGAISILGNPANEQCRLEHPTVSTSKNVLDSPTTSSNSPDGPSNDATDTTDTSGSSDEMFKESNTIHDRQPTHEITNTDQPRRVKISSGNDFHNMRPKSHVERRQPITPQTQY